MERKWHFWQVCAGLSGLIGVAAGAAGAHAIPDAIASALVEKASFYQLIHSLALLALVTRDGRIAQLARLGFIAGILLFSGSLYLKGFGLTESAPLAPAGGILLMLGWLLTATAGIKQIHE